MPALAIADTGAVRVITLDRPDVRNALDRGLRQELVEALDRAEGEPAVRALVLTGSGRAFCSGMDLTELEAVLEGSPEQHLADSQELGRLFLRLYSFPKPVVAAVNGHAVAGGAGLASVCDLVIMNSEARIGYSEARIGFVAALVGVFLVRMVGERVARELLLEARLLTAQEALTLGLVNEVVPPDQVLAHALRRATAVASNSPAALAITKRLLLETADLSLQEALDRAAELNARARQSPDLREGIRAFLAKREPRWRIPGSPVDES